MKQSTRLAALVICLALPLHAAVPGQISHQGLLLDDQGVPVQGHVALDLTLYDALRGGTSLWTESHGSVPVLDGVYDVSLGSVTPFTAAVWAGGALFLEVSVDGEVMVPRQRLVSVPTALRAETAEVGETTLDVGGIPAAFVSQLYENVDYDGGAPPNDDPREGVADADGDGIANFLDPDNDADGLSDVYELANGSDINVPSPTCCTFAPPTSEASLSNTITVTGAGFDPAMTVAFGSENPTPQNVTSTSFTVDVGPQPAGNAAVLVTHPNGESAADIFEFVENQPVIFSIAPSAAYHPVEVTIVGSGFVPGISVTFGLENPVAQVRGSAIVVTVGPQPPGTAPVTVSYPSGKQDTASFEWLDPSTVKRVFTTSTLYDGNLGGLAGADAICNAVAASVDLGGTYQAWLSDGVDSPDTRFNAAGPYVFADATVIATDYADLTNGSIGSSLRRDELGRQIFTSGGVWTGVSAGGSSVAPNCSGFTSTTGTGTRGSVYTSGASWSDASAIDDCSDLNHLYCFQQ